MTTPTQREAPISLRLGKDREERFESFRSREKLKQSEAIHRLMDLGLEAEGFPDPKAAPKVGAQIGPARAAPGSRLKQDPAVKKRWKV